MRWRRRSPEWRSSILATGTLYCAGGSEWFSVVVPAMVRTFAASAARVVVATASAFCYYLVIIIHWPSGTRARAPHRKLRNCPGQAPFRTSFGLRERPTELRLIGSPVHNLEAPCLGRGCRQRSLDARVKATTSGTPAASASAFAFAFVRGGEDHFRKVVCAARGAAGSLGFRFPLAPRRMAAPTLSLRGRTRGRNWKGRFQQRVEAFVATVLTFVLVLVLAFALAVAVPLLSKERLLSLGRWHFRLSLSRIQRPSV
mmetsp:Transcript_34979/g.104332  ORF Transcript_34979/g.104332 Transcript_34979/m.104332 type:complete len:257 (-) Transcript_34979:530-1300(-)